MKKILLVMVCLILGNAEDSKIPYKMAEVKAKHVAHGFHSLMKNTMKKTLKECCILAAAKFCVNDSKKKLEEFNSKLEAGLSLKRISLKNRNKDAYPLKDEINIVKSFDLLEASSVYLPSITQVVGENKFKVYFPTTLSERTCKKCHGLEKDINPKVLRLIQHTYPNDKALNYKAGQVRGAVVVTVDMKK
jgi:hypothetical protein